MDLDTGDIFLFQYKVRPGLFGCIEGCIRCMSDSQYSHAAFIWRDPIIPLDALRDVLHPPDTSNGYKHKHEHISYTIQVYENDIAYAHFDGVYLWDSDYFHTVEGVDHEKNQGCQLTKLSEYMAIEGIEQLSIFRRSPKDAEARALFDKKVRSNKTGVQVPILTQIYEDECNKPYDTSLCNWLCACLRCRCWHRRDDQLFCSALVSLILTRVGVLPENTDWSIISPGELSIYKSWCVNWLQWVKPYTDDADWQWRDIERPLNFDLGVGQPKSSKYA